MEINGYVIKDPINISEDEPSFNKVTAVPYSKSVISDYRTSDVSEEWEIVLEGKQQIDDVLGMLKQSKIVHLLFDDINRFYYVDNVGVDWSKRMVNFRRMGLKLKLYRLSTKQKFKLSYFKNVQRSDFIKVTGQSPIPLPEAFVDNVNTTPNFSRTGYFGGINCFLDPVSPVTFYGIKSLFRDGLIRYSDGGGRFYRDKDVYTGNPVINNNSMSITHQKGSSNNLLVSTPSVTNHLTFEQYNLLFQSFLYEDRHIQLNMGLFECEGEIGLVKYRCKYGEPILTINKPQMNLYHGPYHRFQIVTHPLGMSYGTLTRTTTNPTPLIRDMNIGGTPPSNMLFDRDMGFIKWAVNNDGSNELNNMTVYGTGLKMNTHWQLLTGGYDYHFILSPLKCHYRHAEQMTVLSGTWTLHTDGLTFEGIPNYRRATSGGLSASVTVDVTNVRYNIYLMAKNGTTTNSSFTFSLNGAGQGTVTIPSSSGTMAHYVYLGSHHLNNASNILDLFVTAGTMDFFYILVVPQTGRHDMPQEMMNYAINDYMMSYEVD